MKTTLTILSLYLGLFSFTGNEEVCLDEPSIVPIENMDCYWSEMNTQNVSGTWGDACGRENSVRIRFYNPYSSAVRVAFYIENYDGTYNVNGPYVERVRPGQSTNHFNCNGSGNYIVLAAWATDSCYFPPVN